MACCRHYDKWLLAERDLSARRAPIGEPFMLPRSITSTQPTLRTAAELPGCKIRTKSHLKQHVNFRSSAAGGCRRCREAGARWPGRLPARHLRSQCSPMSAPATSNWTSRARSPVTSQLVFFDQLNSSSRQTTSAKGNFRSADTLKAMPSCSFSETVAIGATALA